MVDRLVHRSRRLRGLSPTSVEPSPRRHRINSASEFEIVAVDAVEIDPQVGVIDSNNIPSRELERKIPILSRILF